MLHITRHQSPVNDPTTIFLVANSSETRHHYRMTSDEFIASGQRIYGKSGWQKQLAERLKMAPATINRYARGHVSIPVVIALAMRGLEGEK